MICFRVNRSVRFTLLEVGGVYLEHTTLRVPSETTTSNRRIMLSNIGTTLDLSWHDNVGNISMPNQILGWPNSSCKLGMYRLYNHIIAYHQQQPNSQLEQRL